MEETFRSPDQDGQYVPPIMRIPREMRGIIFNKLSQLEMVCLRYVCQAWREDVDDFCDFTASLDDRLPDRLARLLNLRIVKCKVVHLLEPLPTTAQDGHLSLFRYPKILSSLKMVSENVSPENFQRLLMDVSPQLREFCGVLTPDILQYPNYSQEFPQKFCNLKRLRLSVSTMSQDKPVLGPPPQFNDQLFSKFFSSKMKTLKMFAIEIRCLGALQCSRFSGEVLSFIAAHHSSLEHVDFDLVQGHGIPMSFDEPRPLNQSDLDRINISELKKLSKLQSLRVVNSTAVGVDIWQNVLAWQRHLQFLETDILPAPNTLYRQIISNCEETIVHVDIGDLTIDFEGGGLQERRYFDCAVFQNCRLLRKLTLDRDTLRRRPADWPPSAELINLQCLPEYLEELNINYFLLLSDELLLLFSGKGAQDNMQNVALTQCGDAGEFGVDGSVLEKIISMKNIDFIEISQLNYTYPEEREKLNQILTTFGYTMGHQYFQLERRSQNFQVEFDDFEP